jgi:amino acid adenylation domain-containing protein
VINHQPHVMLPLTLTQQDIYFDQLHHQGCPLYNVGGYMRFGAVDVEQVQHAHAALVSDHDAFGLRIVNRDEQLGQYISSQRTLELPLIDFSEQADADDKAQQWLTALFETCVDIEDRELFRTFLLKLADDKFYYVGFAHHLAMDGFGFANWAAELGRYLNGSEGEVANKRWQQVVAKDTSYLEGKRYAKDRVYWQKQLQDLPPPLLSPDYLYQFSHTTQIPSRRKILPISSTKHQALEQRARQLDVPVAQLYLAVVAIYFSQVYDQPALVIGSPAHNRSDHAQKQMIGVFTSVSPICLTVDPQQSLALFCQQIKTTMRQNFKHQRFPIGQMQREFLTHSERESLYDVGFNYLKLDSKTQVGNGSAELVYLSHNHDQTPVMVTIWDHGAGEAVEIQLDHNLAYLTDQDVELLASRLDGILDQISDDTVDSIGQLQLMSVAEHQQLMAFSQGQRLDYGAEVLLHQLFEHQVAQHPDAIAVEHKGAVVSFAELNQRANVFAHYLMEHGIKVGDFVGISLTRTVDMVAAVLGILKAGAAYIPLDPDYPSARLNYMIGDSNIKLVITESALVSSLAVAQYLVVDQDLAVDKDLAVDQEWVSHQLASHNPDLALSGEQLAYVIYTSGSTGRPKGVAIRHRNTCAMLHWANSVYAPPELHRVLASTSLNFDLSVFELFVPLSFGYQCVLVDDALALLETPINVTLINTVPSAIKALMSEQAIPAGVKVVNLAGEPLTSQVINELLVSGYCDKVCNLYGPSEDTTYSTYAEFTQPVRGVPEIGRVISNSQSLVLSQHQGLLPIGCVGELYLGGDGVARGYLNHDELTAQRFMTHPLVDGPVYRTGDLVRYRADGQLVFVGRIDDLVKVRGFRIELGEIEYELTRLDAVTEAVVCVLEQRLVAYVVVDGAGVMSNDGASADDDEQAELKGQLKLQLQQTLPDYMMPSAFVCLDKFPLTPNGKVDKRALPKPRLAAAVTSVDYIAPQSSTEQKLAQIWAKLLALPVDDIGALAQFFDLGGHSLLVVNLTGEIRQAFGVGLTIKQIFDTPVLRQLAQRIEQGSDLTTRPEVLATSAGVTHLPLSFAQQRLWFIDQLQGGSTNYNMPVALEVRGVFNVPVLQRSLQCIVERHQVLRTVYQQADDSQQIVQLITDAVNFTVTLTDLTHLHGETRDAEVTRLRKLDAVTDFVLDRDVMLRANWLQLGQAQGVLLLNMHHIASDGWSFGIFIKELMTLYRAFSQGLANPLPALSIQYADYALWQHEFHQGTELQQQLQYWLTQLAGAPTVHSLPHNAPPATGSLHRGATHHHPICATLLTRVQQTARANDMTLFMQLHALLALLLSKHSNSHDIVIGTPVANRMQLELAPLIGFFVNSLVLRVNTDYVAFADYFAHVRQVNLDALNNQDLPFEQVVEHLHSERSAAHSPLFQILFSMVEDQAPALDIAGVTLAVLARPEAMNKFDLEIEAQLTGDGLVINWMYDTALFSAQWVAALANQFERMLQSVTEPAVQRIEQIAMLSASEYAYLVHQLNDNALAYPQEATLHQLFERQAAAKPQHPVLVFGEQQVSYQSLNEQANQLAHYLLERGLKAGQIVGISTDRGIAMVVSVLAILKAGCAYVPVDPAYPRARRQHIIGDSQMNVVLTNACYADDIDAGQLILLDDPALFGHCALTNPQLDMDAEQLAYAIYTSGSTGLPKGVAIRHRNTVAMLHWANDTYSESELARVLASTSLNFDLSVFELFLPLCFGYQCVLVDNALALLDREVDISLLNTVPSAVMALLEQGAVPASVKVVNLAGEPLSASVVNNLLAQGIAKVCNLYGPSEDTTYSTWAEFTQPLQRIPEIGRVISNSQAYVLSEQGSLLPHGVLGELYLGGHGVARGYLNQDELTASKFVVDPFSDGLLYRTGDMVRYLEDGELAFVARKDEQVKIRGFRIELAEIEQQLLLCPQLQAAVVVAVAAPGGKNLVAYMTAHHSTALTNDALIKICQARLAEHLPDYMMPRVFVVLDALPLTPNGKVDKKALPEVQIDLSQLEFIKANTDTEQTLVEVWAQVLKIGQDQISTVASFFHLGGHSLLAVTLTSEIERRLGCQLSLKEVFDHATVKAMAECIDGHDGGRVAAKIAVVARDAEYHPLSFGQQRLWFLQQLEGDSIEYNMPAALKVSGVFEPNLAATALSWIVARHESLRTRFIEVDGQPVQQIMAAREVTLAVDDLSAYPGGQKQVEVARLSAENNAAVFDLAQGELLKVRYIRLDDREGILLFNMNHIISDGWSIGLLNHEFIAKYRELTEDIPADLPPLTVQVVDYAHWQRTFLAPEQLAKPLDYWQTLMAGAPASHSLPMDRARSARPDDRVSKAGSLHRQTLSAQQGAEIKTLLQHTHTTLFMFMQAVFAVHIGRLSHEHDVVLGAPVAGRNHHQLTPLIGLFLNTQLFRSEFADDPSLFELLQRTREQHLNSADFNMVPFESVVEQLNPARSLTQSPLFQILINHDNTQVSELQLADCRFDAIDSDEVQNKYDITLYIHDHDDGSIDLNWAYDAGLFDAQTIDLFATELSAFIDALLRQPELPVLQHGWATSADWAAIAPSIQTPDSCQLMDLFEGKVNTKGEAVALVFDDQPFTYAQLDQRVNQLAHYLTDHGVSVGSRVAIATSRNEQRVLAILAVLKLGGCYVPLSEELVQPRLQYMLENSAASLVLTDTVWLADHAWLADQQTDSGYRLTVLDDPLTRRQIEAQSDNLVPAARVASDSEAHIIYTSGSTGLPKGVSGTYGATFNRIKWMLDTFAYEPDEVVAHITSMAFIRGVWELLVPLCGGAKLVLCARDTVKDTRQLWQFLGQHQVNRIVTAPSLMKALADVASAVASADVEGQDQASADVPLKHWFVSGEPLLQSYANEVLSRFPGIGLYNLYGSTEVMSDVLCQPITACESEVWVPVGQPIANTGVFVMGEDGCPVPDNVVGELVVIGSPLSNGYIGAVAQSSAFIDTPLGRGYRTGDLGRRRSGGQVSCLGRIDDQVKIRGYRIEPGEIIKTLSSHREVGACHVMPIEAQGQTMLVAYITPQHWRGESDAPLQAALKSFAASALPSYMNPAYFVLLQSIPLRPNGKVDRQALPTSPRLFAQGEVVAPATDAERQVGKLWAQILNIEASEVDVTTSFFDLGGHSLLVTQLLKRLEEQFGLTLSYQQFFGNNDIRFLAAKVDRIRLAKAVLSRKSEAKGRKNKFVL